MKNRIYYEIYKDGKLIATDFCYYYSKDLEEIYKDKGYTIRRIKNSEKN